MKRAYHLALLVWAVSACTWADVIELTDGRKLNGTLNRSGDVMTIKTDDGKTVTVKPDQIGKVTLTNSTTPEEAAASEWSRITQQAKTADDLQTVIDNYKKFVEKYPTAKQTPDARTVLEAYQILAQADPVKFRGRWMARAQVDVTIKQWAEDAQPAAEAYRAGRFTEALDAAKKILTQGNQNPDAMTLAGLAAYRNNTMPAARQYFTSLAAADPGSVLAENNLAVVATIQKNPAEGMLHFAKALQIAPDNRFILDNIVEALNGFVANGGDKNNTAFRALLKQYEPAEARMEENLGKKGLVRWGSTWVTKEQQAKLARHLEDVKAQVVAIDTQYAAARLALATLDTQIRQAADDADSYAKNVAFNDQQMFVGQQQRVDISLYAMQRDVAAQNYDRTMRYKVQLETQRAQMATAANEFFAQAHIVKAAMATGGLSGQYSGTVHILDLGDLASLPPPAAVPDPAPLAELKVPPTIINQPPAPATPPVVITVPVGVPIVPRR